MKRTILLFALSLISYVSFSQAFVPGFDTFSGKKPAYVHLKDGTQLEGTIEDLDRKKGLIEEITLKVNKKKVKILPENIDKMYLPASGLTKLNNAIDNSFNLSKIENSGVNSQYINDGYALFENVDVLVKGKKYTLLMQLLNPLFVKNISVYFDPYAKETMSVGLGMGFEVGGIDKSYYIKKDKEIAYKLEKKNYDETFETIYKECPSLVKKIKKNHEWKDLAKHIFAYGECK